MPSPEELARKNIDELLTACGWKVQDRKSINLEAAHGVVIREALLKDRDEVDYLLFDGGKQTRIPQWRDQQFVTPDDGRKFTELYNVQHLQRSQREAVRHRRGARRVDARERIDQSAQLDRVSRVCISNKQILLRD
jgi:hypothetical protein